MSPPYQDIRRTRSGQAINRSIEQLKSSPKQAHRPPKSPKPRPKRVKKEKTKIDRLPRLNKPLSELTRLWTHVPIVDIETYVNRSAEQRRLEVEQGKNPGKVKRPMNSFMLYRKAYQNRTKNWCLQNNHQVVSQVCGDSWPLEPQDVKQQFNEWARIERQNHQNAHPGYKFSPAKAGTAKAGKRKASISEEESDLESVDWNGGRLRSGKRTKMSPKPSPTPPVPFKTQPYYGMGSRESSLEPGMTGGYGNSTYHGSNPGSIPPEAYGSLDQKQYWHQQVLRNPQNPHVQDVIFKRTTSPGMNDMSNLAYQPIYYPNHGVINGSINGGMGSYPYNAYQLRPEVKIDPSLMGLDHPYGDPYAIDGGEVILDDDNLMFDQHHLMQQTGNVVIGLKEEYPEYLGTQTDGADDPISHQQMDDRNNQDNWHIRDTEGQSSVVNTPISYQQVDDMNNQHNWEVVDSLGTGDEFNDKWMDGEPGQDA